MFALSRFAVPLAAGVGLVVGAGLYAALRTDRALAPAESARQAPAEASDLDAAAPKRKLGARAGTDAKDASAGAHDVTTWAGADGDASAGAAPPGGAPAGPDVPPADKPAAPAEKPGTPRGSAPVTGGAGAGAGGNTAAPRFRAPGGAVPEGLRRPSDVPGAPLPPAPLPPAPLPPAPGTPAAPAPADDAPNTPNAPPPDAGEGVTASGGAYGARPPSRTADAADAPPGAPVPEARGPEERGPEASDATSRRAAWARAAEGVDAVVIVRASSVDEARAQLALLALPGVPGGARGGPEAVARDGEPADRVLGSFVAELTPEAYAALTAVRPEAAEFLDHERPAGDEPASPDADAARDPTRARESAKPGAAEAPRPGAATSTPPADADKRDGARGAPSAKRGEPAGARGAPPPPAAGPGSDPTAAPPAVPAPAVPAPAVPAPAVPAPAVPPVATPPAPTAKGAAPRPTAPPTTAAPTPSAPPVPSEDDESAKAEADEPVVRRVRIVVVPR